MSYRFRLQPSGQLALVVFEGDISAEEERRALEDFAALPGVNLQGDILVDRSRATLMADPSAVQPQLALARSVFPAGERRPRMAIVAPADLDFGMARMLQTTGGDDAPHDIMVMRNLEDACQWLGVDPDALVWP